MLDCINGYVQKVEDGPVDTYVQSFQVDSATAEADTWLCTYFGPASEGLRNDEARRRVDIAARRAEVCVAGSAPVIVPCMAMVL